MIRKCQNCRFAIQMDPPHSPLVPTQSNMIHGALVAHTHTEYSRSIIQVRTINNAQRLRR